MNLNSHRVVHTSILLPIHTLHLPKLTVTISTVEHSVEALPRKPVQLLVRCHPMPLAGVGPWHCELNECQTLAELPHRALPVGAVRADVNSTGGRPCTRPAAFFSAALPWARCSLLRRSCLQVAIGFHQRLGRVHSLASDSNPN